MSLEPDTTRTETSPLRAVSVITAVTGSRPGITARVGSRRFGHEIQHQHMRVAGRDGFDRLERSVLPAAACHRAFDLNGQAAIFLSGDQAVDPRHGRG